MGHHVTSVQQKVQPPGEGVENVDVGGIEGIEQQLMPAAPPAIIPQHQGRRQDAVDLIVLGEELPPDEVRGHSGGYGGHIDHAIEDVVDGEGRHLHTPGAF